MNGVPYRLDAKYILYLLIYSNQQCHKQPCKRHKLPHAGRMAQTKTIPYLFAGDLNAGMKRWTGDRLPESLINCSLV
jgi:hypothetical protein